MKPYYTGIGIDIYHGDSRIIVPNLPQFSCVVTDPPYGMNRFDTDGKDYLERVGPILKDAFAHVTDPGSMFVFTSTGEVLKIGAAVGSDNFKRMLWMYKPADCTYPMAGWLLTSEAILWFAKGNGGLLERRPYRHDCYIHTRSGMEGVEGHPTIKPLAIIKDLVSRCPIDGVLLDPFMGSGTTLVAAKQLGYKAVGVEIEEKYCDMAARRLDRTQVSIVSVIRKKQKMKKLL